MTSRMRCNRIASTALPYQGVDVPTQISIFIIAKNEGDRLLRTLQSVIDLSADIVLVDSGSTDDTVSIAESMCVRVIYNQWPGYG